MFNSLANLADRRAKVVVIAAIVLAVVAGALGGGVASKLSSFGAEDPDTDSYQASQRLGEATGLDDNPGMIVLVDARGPARSGAGRAKVDQVVRIVRRDRAVGRVATAFGDGRRELLARDGRSTYVAVTFRDEQGEDAVERLRPRL